MFEGLKKLLGFGPKKVDEPEEKKPYEGEWKEILVPDVFNKIITSENKPEIPPQIEVQDGKIKSIDMSSILYFDPFSQPRALWFSDIEKVVFKVPRDLNKYIDLKRAAELALRLTFANATVDDFLIGFIYDEKPLFDGIVFCSNLDEFREQTDLISRREYASKEAETEAEWRQYIKTAKEWHDGIKDEDLPTLEEFKKEHLGKYQHFRDDSQFLKTLEQLLNEVYKKLLSEISKELEELWGKIQYIPLVDIYIKQEAADRLGIDPHIEVYLRMVHNTGRFQAYTPEAVGLENKTLTYDQIAPGFFEYVINVHFKDKDSDVKKVFDYMTQFFFSSPDPSYAHSLAVNDDPKYRIVVPNAFYSNQAVDEWFASDYGFLPSFYLIFSFPSLFKPENFARLDPERIDSTFARFFRNNIADRIGRGGKVGALADRREGIYMETVYEAIKGGLLIPTYEKKYVVRDPLGSDYLDKITDNNVLDSLYSYMYYYLDAANNYFLNPKKYPKEHEEYFKVYKDFFKEYPSFDKLYDEFLDTMKRFHEFYDSTFAKAGELLLIITSFIYPAMAQLLNSYNVLKDVHETKYLLPPYNMLGVFAEIVFAPYIDILHRSSLYSFRTINNLLDKDYLSLDEVLPLIKGINIEYKEEEPIIEEINEEVL
ncbi:hypothetical protein [Caldisericum exile]|uniref:hypothetical protein n=1 Tax=Caldisericum exile TaxID=693075 RepID=UPI003C782A8D